MSTRKKFHAEPTNRARASAQLGGNGRVEVIGGATIGILALAAMVAADYWGGRRERIPLTILYVASWFLTFGLPVILVWLHRSRQQHAIKRVRSIYAVAIEWLLQNRDAEARRALQSVRNWERHWRIGNSLPYRSAYSGFVIFATTLVALCHFVIHANIYSQTGYGQVAHKSFRDTLLHLIDHPIQLWFIGIVSLLFGFRACEHLKDLAGKPWSDFYGDRLEAALKSGRSINNAPWQKRPLPTAGVSARELLGLPRSFTSAQLRHAWLQLVRELHPDHWSTAGEEVRKMKEAALKRVNAARDELARQVTD